MSDAYDVLLVDEPSSLREAMVSRLSNAGMSVACVATGEAAREHLAERRVDCIVTEYRAPGIDGLALTRECSADGVSVVLFTDDGDEAVASEAIAAGVTDYVSKASEEALDRLLTGVERAVGRGRARRSRAAAAEVVERVTAGFLALDSDWRFTYLNRKVADLLGKRREDLLGENIWEAIPEAIDSEFYHRYREAMDSQQPVTFETYVPEVASLHEGGGRWYKVHAYPSQDGLSVYFIDVTDEKLAEQRYRDLFESWPDAVGEIDDQGRYLSANEAMAESVGVSREDLEGTRFHDLFDADLADDRLEMGRAAMESGERLVDEDSRDGRYFHNIYVPVETSDERDTFQIISRDITEHHEREREIERQRDELETLDRINAVIRDINRELVQASSREEIECVVSERLADSDSYLFAWVGELNVATEVIEPRTSAGQEAGYLDEVTVTFDDSETGWGPGGRAVRTQETHVTQDLGALPEPWGSIAHECGFRSVVAVPLAYGGTLYGVLCVYADRPYAFDDRETAVLSELGETIAYAINAVESKRALVADRATELVLSNRDEESFFIDASRRTGATIALDGVTETTDGALVEFCTVSGDSGRVLELAEQADTIECVRLVSERSDGDRFEFVYTGPSVVATLADHGVKVRSVVAEGGESRIVATLPHDADVRRVVEAFKTTYPESELLAQREAGGSAGREQGLRERIDERLTDRQLACLEAAYFGGFFEWPRDSTGEQLAASLDIAAPTFHQHLRAVERKFAAAYLDGRDPA
jgi:PAS domain S-box-containing protein